MGTVNRRSFLKHGAVGLAVVSGTLSGLGWVDRLAVAAPNKSDLPEPTVEYAKKRHLEKGLQCSQSVVHRYAESRGWNEQELTDAALPLGLGMGGAAAPCGAVSGSYMVLGLHAGSLTDDRAVHLEKAQQLFAQFTEQFLQQEESLICGEILQHDPTTPEGMAAFYESLFASICAPLIATAMRIVDGILAAEEAG